MSSQGFHQAWKKHTAPQGDDNQAKGVQPIGNQKRQEKKFTEWKWNIRIDLHDAEAHLHRGFAIGAATPLSSLMRSTMSTKPLAKASRVWLARPSYVREAMAKSDVDPIAADEKLTDANAAALPLALALVQCLAAALACWMSSIACVDNSPWLKIIRARCWKVGALFGTME
jgi:hypothetical protein